MVKKNILGVNFNHLSLSELMNEIDTVIQHKKKKKIRIAFSNPEFIVESKANQLLKNYLLNVDYNLADGMGIIWASKLLKRSPLKERVTGTDFVPALMKLSANKNYSIYFLGGKPGIGEKATKKLQKMFPGVNNVGHHHGYFDEITEAAIIKEINTLSPDFLMVCLGNPRQEEWIEKNWRILDAKVIFGNGGALDFWSSEVKRAPFWLQRNGLEWVYRLFQDFSKKRILRQMRLIHFIFLLFTQITSQKFKKT